MESRNTILNALLGIQADVFRVAFDPLRYGLTFKRVQLASGIPPSTLRTYTEGKAEMPLSALYRLVGIVPDELLSMLLPDGRLIVRMPEGIDHDAIAEWSEKYNAKKLAAHRKDSECEEMIGPTEHDELTGIVLEFPGVAA
jgi:hypothetical protein